MPSVIFDSNGHFVFKKAIFLFLLFLWTTSIFFTNAIYQISWVALNLYFFWHIFYHKNIDLVSKILKDIKFPAIFAICIFITICISNLLNAQYLSNKSWETTFFMIFRFGVIFLALCYFYKIEYFDKKILLTMLFVALLTIAAGGLYQVITDPQVIKNVGKGLKGLLNNRNGFGLFMGLGVVASLAFLRKNSLKFIAASIFAFFMIFSFSRSSWVASLGASLLLFTMNVKNFKKQYLIYIVLFALFLVGLYLSFDTFGKRLDQLLKGNTTHRDFIWTYSIDMIKQNPIIGYGLDSFRDLPNSPALKRGDFNATHNMILEILLYTGITGLIFYASLTINLLKTAFSAREFGILSVLCYFVVVCQFDYGAYMSKSILSLIVIFGFLAYSSRVKQT